MRPSRGSAAWSDPSSALDRGVPFREPGGCRSTVKCRLNAISATGAAVIITEIARYEVRRELPRIPGPDDNRAISAASFWVGLVRDAPWRCSVSSVGRSIPPPIYPEKSDVHWPCLAVAPTDPLSRSKGTGRPAQTIRRYFGMAAQATIWLTNHNQDTRRRVDLQGHNLVAVLLWQKRTDTNSPLCSNESWYLPSWPTGVVGRDPFSKGCLPSDSYAHRLCRRAKK